MDPDHVPWQPSRLAAKWLDLANSLLSRRWIRFGIIGGLATLAYFLAGLFFVVLLKWPTLTGNGLAYALGFIVSYMGQKRWTFRDNQSASASLPKFAIAQLAGLALNSIIVEQLLNLGARYELAMICASVIVPLMVYFLCRIWVFRPRHSQTSDDHE